MNAEARALENPKIEPSEVKNMKRNIMKKLASLAVKFGETNLSNLLIKGRNSFKNRHLQSMVKRCGWLEALRKTCFSSLPQRFTIVNKNNYLYQ